MKIAENVDKIATYKLMQKKSHVQKNTVENAAH